MRLFRRLHTGACAAVCVLAMLPGMALAAGTAVLASEDEPMTVMWLDQQTLRLGSANDSEYMLIRDNKAYSIAMENGQPLVIDMEGMVEMMMGMVGQDKVDLDNIGRVHKVESTGGRETIAGIEGRTYTLTVTDTDGEQETMEAVLTDDARVVEMTAAYTSVMQAMFGINDPDRFIGALPRDGKGMLRMGSDFKLESISDEKPKAEYFELPAKPMTLQEMMQSLGKQ